MLQGDPPPAEDRADMRAQGGDVAQTTPTRSIADSSPLRREREDPGESSLAKSRRREETGDDGFCIGTVTVPDIMSRKVVNDERSPKALIRGLPADLVEKGMERVLKGLKEMGVFSWVKEQDVPAGTEMLDCG